MASSGRSPGLSSNAVVVVVAPGWEISDWDSVEVRVEVCGSGIGEEELLLRIQTPAKQSATKTAIVRAETYAEDDEDDNLFVVRDLFPNAMLRERERERDVGM